MKRTIGTAVLLLFVSCSGVVYRGPTDPAKRIVVLNSSDGDVIELTVDSELVFRGVIPGRRLRPLLTSVPVPLSRPDISVVVVRRNSVVRRFKVRWNEFNTVVVGLSRADVSITAADDPVFQ